ncbi:hypothetical protein ACQP0C_19600 [Nocardia sp. CA-129566]
MFKMIRVVTIGAGIAVAAIAGAGSAVADEAPVGAGAPIASDPLVPILRQIATGSFNPRCFSTDDPTCLYY